MKEYFGAELKEDCIIFTLNEAAHITPADHLRHDLNDYIINLRKSEEREEDVRLTEIEQRHEDYARLILEHLDAGKELPAHKSYSLNV